MTTGTRTFTIDTTLANVGDIENKGFELQLRKGFFQTASDVEAAVIGAYAYKYLFI